MQTIIIIEKVDGTVQNVSETPVSDEVYVALVSTLRRSRDLTATLQALEAKVDALTAPDEQETG